ncbi:MAG: cytochrome c oxidase subunit II [Planctomycetota bacterium]
MIAFQDPLGQLPEAASTFAPSVDGLFYFCVWVSIFSFALIAGLLTWSSVMHRRKTEDQPPISNVTHNTTLEVIWTLIPTIIVFIIFAWGWKGNLDQSVAPSNALQYRVTGQQWNWLFYHPGSSFPANELYVPVNTPVKITMDSKDVIHSFFVPAFRVKRDVLPGRYQIIWFEATKTGVYDMFCAEYCGTEHSKMTTKVHVVTQEEYDEQPWNVRPDDPIEWGAQLFTTMGCNVCHSTDGSPKIGPTFQGIWGKEEEVILADGSTQTITVDREYIRESLYTPQAKIVKGFEAAGAMTAFSAAEIPDTPEGDSHLDALVAYIESLKDQ